jgi:hypothetical protein
METPEDELAKLLDRISTGLKFIADVDVEKSTREAVLNRYAEDVRQASLGIKRLQDPQKESPTLAESQRQLAATRARLAELELKERQGPAAIKPPIGLKPRHIAEKERFQVVAAIRRYIESGRHVPREWLEEYEDLRWRCTAQERALANFIEDQMEGGPVS